jgi:hypothetical protein
MALGGGFPGRKMARGFATQRENEGRTSDPRSSHQPVASRTTGARSHRLLLEHALLP